MPSPINPANLPTVCGNLHVYVTTTDHVEYLLGYTSRIVINIIILSLALVMFWFLQVGQADCPTDRQINQPTNQPTNKQGCQDPQRRPSTDCRGSVRHPKSIVRLSTLLRLLFSPCHLSHPARCVSHSFTTTQPLSANSCRSFDLCPRSFDILLLLPNKYNSLPTTRSFPFVICNDWEYRSLSFAISGITI